MHCTLSTYIHHGQINTTHKYWKNHYQNISATKYALLRASSLQNVMQNIESHVLPPLLNPNTTPPPHPTFVFCFFKNLSRLKILILSSVYPEINFPAEPVMKINNMSRPKMPAHPPQDQMVVSLWSISCTLTGNFKHRHENLSFLWKHKHFYKVFGESGAGFYFENKNQTG